MRSDLSGLYPATVTPFRQDLHIDVVDLQRHFEDTARADGVKGLVVNGVIGELFSLTVSEQAEIIRLARATIDSTQRVIAGIEARTVVDAVALAKSAEQAGADAVLVLPPFDVRAYRRLCAHTPSVRDFFEGLARATELPIIIFQYPRKSGCTYSSETLNSLAEIDSVIGIKSAAQDLSDYRPIWDTLNGKVSILAASDSPPLLEMIEYGCNGALIGISVIAPEKWAQLLSDSQTRDERRQHFARFALPLMSAVFENQTRSGPTSDAAATKEALVQLGKLTSSLVRPPAVNCSEDERDSIRTALRQAGLV